MILPALSFTNQTDAAGLGSANDLSSSQSYAPMIAGGVAVDFNNDGYIDIFITAFGSTDSPAQAGQFLLMQNNGPDDKGQWSFTDVAQSAGVNRLVQFNTWTEGSGSSWGDYDLDGDLDLFVCAYSSAVAGNRLFRNDGPDTRGIWRFTDMTQQAGLESAGIAGFLPSFIDFNNDRYPELIIIADAGSSQYFINNNDGTFTNATNTARGLQSANAMGIDIADINNDQRLDFFVSNIRFDFPAVGGNILLIQNSDHSFDDHAFATGAFDGHWGWGSLINDFDHDGDKDILETNGFFGFNGDPVTLFLNDGGDTLSFTESTLAAGINHSGQGRGLIRLDADNDYILPIHANPTYCGSSPIEAHIGLASESTINAIQVAWPDGSFTTWTDMPVDQIHTLVASSHPADLDSSGAVDLDDISAFLTRFMTQDLAADHNGDTYLDFLDISRFIGDYRNAMAP